MDLYYPSRCDPVWLILHLFIEGLGSCFAGHGILNFYIRADLNPILVAIFCGETIGRTAVIGAVLVIGAAACYNVYEAAHKD